jgi:hypothetical protein
VKNIQFLYILLDRSLIYYSHIINWAHGRRDDAAGRTDRQTDAERIGYTSRWDSAARGVCAKFFREATEGEGGRETGTEQQLKDIIIDQLQKISNSEQREGR